MPDEMIERVARAMWAKYEAITADVTRSQVRPWDEMPQSNRDFWLKIAAAGIEGMREPTPKMLYAEVDGWSIGGQLDGLSAGLVWQAMIDAALAERD